MIQTTHLFILFSKISNLKSSVVFQIPVEVVPVIEYREALTKL